MKRLHFDYFMQIDYSVIVTRCNFTIKCIPQDNARQKIGDYHIEIHPNTYYSFGYDGLNNKQIYGLNGDPHQTFIFRISGEAETGLADYEEYEDDSKSMIFRHSYGLSAPGENIRQFFSGLELSGNALDKASIIMDALMDRFTYRQHTTSIGMSAEEAFTQGCGVCQDIAHIYIALLHLADIPARYVTGLLAGEGESHAWVEVLYDHKWYGFDPTNRCRVHDDHIKLGVGRDARDCSINRGIMHGGGLHTQTVKVSVKEIGD